MMLEESASVRSMGGHVRQRCTHLERALAVVAVVVGLGLGLSGAAGATGILPPGNPSANIPPSNGDFLISIDSARAQEGVGPMDVNEAQLDALPAPQQLFIVLNDERIDRGLPPIEFMTAQLDAAANQGAQSGGDPPLPSSVTGGAPVAWGGGIWAGGTSSVLESDYYWMYSDGAGSNSSNEACPSAGSPVLLDAPRHHPARTAFVRRAAVDPLAGCGRATRRVIPEVRWPPRSSRRAVLPTDVTMTWQQAESEIAGTQTVGVAAMPNGSGYWEAEANGTVGAFGTAHNYGSLTVALNAPIVGIVATPNGGGYWLVGSDGGIFSFGNARFFGSTGSLRLNRPIVGMASDARRKRVLVGRVRRRHLQLRRCEVPRFDGRQAPQPAGRRHGG